MRAAGVLALVLAAGCRFDAPYVLVTVEDAPVAIDQLHVTAAFTQAGVTRTDAFDVPASPHALVFPTRFTLQLPAGASGTLELTVDGLAAGQPVVSTTARAIAIAGNGEYPVTVTLGARPDGGAGDLAPAGDLAEAPCVWVSQTLPAGTPALLNVWGSGPNDVYAVGYNQTILHSTDHGATWTRVSASGTAKLANIWGADPTHIVTVGLGDVVLYSSGGSWPAATLPAPFDTGAQNFLGAWGSSAGDVYIVGSGGAILHSTDRQTWVSAGNTSASPLFSIWGASPTDVFAVGSSSTVRHSTDGTTWTPVATPLSADYTNIWGSGPDNIFIVGLNGVILHSTDDGAHWLRQDVGSNLPFDGDWGIGDDVFVVSGDDFFTGGSAWHSFDRGAHWSQETLPSGAGLYGMWGAAYDDVYAAGGVSASTGILYHRQRQ